MVVLSDGKQYLEAIDKENPAVVVIIHIYSVVSSHALFRTLEALLNKN